MRRAHVPVLLLHLLFVLPFAHSLHSDGVAVWPFSSCTSCHGTTSSGGYSTALGMLSTASGDVSTAIGYNTTAGGNSSFAVGVNARTISDRTVPGGSSCGGCVSMGLDTTTIGDWATAMGSGTTARGYASMALGQGTVANTFGEVALGLYSELEPAHTEDELRNQSVIPKVDERDVVLRVGIGCAKGLPGGGLGCNATRRLDALRVYKSGALYLKKSSGEVLPDVQAAIEKCHADHDQTKDELKAIKETLATLTARLVALEARTRRT